MILIEIDGRIIREDRSKQPQQQRAERELPVRITWEDGTTAQSFGAEIDGTIRVACEPREEAAEFKEC